VYHIFNNKLIKQKLSRIHSNGIIRGPFAKFVYSPYYAESELCGGAMTVSFSQYFSW